MCLLSMFGFREPIGDAFNTFSKPRNMHFLDFEPNLELKTKKYAFP